MVLLKFGFFRLTKTQLKKAALTPDDRCILFQMIDAFFYVEFFYIFQIKTLHGITGTLAHIAHIALFRHALTTLLDLRSNNLIFF